MIVLESVSHGLSENSDEISRKARKVEGFFRPKSGGLQKQKKKVFAEIKSDFSAGFFRPISSGLQKKKKKIFAEIESNFSAKVRIFFRSKTGGLQKKKKKIFAEIYSDFTAKFGNSNVSGGLFSYGGAIFNFSQKIGLKSIKNVRF